MAKPPKGRTNAAMPSALLTRLREATGPAHIELEKQVDIPSASLDLGLYRNILAGFLGFYEPMETRLASHDGWAKLGLNLPERNKIAWLTEDLLALGFSADEVADLPRCLKPPALGDFGEALGAAYVLEGATLGGRHILNNLAGTRIPANARHFYTSYGPAVGENWRLFCQALEAYTGEPEAVARGANETFAALGAWLTERKVTA